MHENELVGGKVIYLQILGGREVGERFVVREKDVERNGESGRMIGKGRTK